MSTGTREGVWEAREGGRDLLLPVCCLEASCLFAVPMSQPCSALHPDSSSTFPQQYPNTVFPYLQTPVPHKDIRISWPPPSLRSRCQAHRAPRFKLRIPSIHQEVPSPQRSELQFHRVLPLSFLSWGLRAASYTCCLFDTLKVLFLPFQWLITLYLVVNNSFY